MKILVTGGSGFVGQHLIRELSKNLSPEQIVATFHKNRPTGEGAKLATWVSPDFGNSAQLDDLIDELRPHHVYHLAAISFMPEANKDPDRAREVNVGHGLRLFESILKCHPSAKILYSSSSEVYGKVDPSENPIDENRTPDPANVYSQTKLDLERIGLEIAKSKGLNLIVARPFNHTGPGQNINFAAPAFAKQVADIEAGKQEPTIVTGNLSAERDFTDVRDIVAGYAMLMDRGEPCEIYHLCSGIPRKIKEILDILLGLSKSENIRHEYDPSRMRPSENSIVYGSFEKIARTIGWEPKIDFPTTISDLLDAMRQGNV